MGAPRLMLVILISAVACLGAGETRCNAPANVFAQLSSQPTVASPTAEAPSRARGAVRVPWPGEKITMKPRKEKYFLGENILVDYQISYEGDGRLQVWCVTGPNACDRSHVIATDQAANRMPESTLRFYEAFGSSGPFVSRGHPFTYTIAIMRHCRFERPGTYRVRAVLDLLGPTSDLSIEAVRAIPENDPRWAETTIVLEMPSSAQARQIVERMYRDRQTDSDDHNYGSSIDFIDGHIRRIRRRNFVLLPYADFTCLQYPVYLPILLDKFAAHNAGDEEALTGIAHIPTPEATEALVRLLKHPGRDFALKVAGALNDRLPKSPLDQQSHRCNPIVVPDADPELVQGTWRNNFASDVREFARQRLTDDEPTRIRCGAFMLEAIGATEDMPALIATLDATVPVMERIKPDDSGVLPLPEWVSPPRRACVDLVHAIEAIAVRGATPKADPRTSGEIIHFVLALKQQKAFRPAGWERRYSEWLEHPTPFVREVTLFNAPCPLPESLRVPYDTALRALLATTLEPSVVYQATRIALEQRTPRDEVVGMLVDRLDARGLFPYLYALISGTLDNGQVPEYRGACVPPVEPNQVAAGKAAWKRFLNENRQAIREGKSFYPDEQDEVSGMLLPPRP